MFKTLLTSDIAQVIQLAIAPVFLLTSLGALLGVMVNRLVRVVDRARSLELLLTKPEYSSKLPELMSNLARYAERAQMLNQAIALCVLTAVLVCAVVITLFVGALLSFNGAVPAAILFIAALLTFLWALITLLREVFMATATLKFSLHNLSGGQSSS